jgi:hypothetical protein
MNLANFDPEKICDIEGAKTAFRAFLNLLEELQAENARLRKENQELRDEIARLKGEKGKPNIPGNKDTSSDVSSEKERKTREPREKGSKNDTIKITREDVRRVDKSQLPPDAEFKGYEETIVQDLKISLDNVLFRREKYYSPSLQETITATLPLGYNGQFGPGIKTFILSQYYLCNVTEPKIRAFLENVGISISEGQVSKFVLDTDGRFGREHKEVLRAGLASSIFQQMDDTGTRVNGLNQYCHILCSKFYTYYSTRPRKDRLTVLDILLGRDGERSYFLDEKAYALIRNFNVSEKIIRVLRANFPQEREIFEKAFLDLLKKHLPEIGSIQQTRILEAGAIAAYHAQTTFPIVYLLLTDDAPQFKVITDKQALCWVHDGRHYKKLQPCFDLHRRLLDEFLDTYWKYYAKLLEFKQNPRPEDRTKLAAEFEDIFSKKTGYDQLDERISKTFEKKANLLQVLDCPEVPLHNNASELGARTRVTKRDVSYGPRTELGKDSWDTFMTLMETAKKVGISFYEFLADRVLGAGKIANLGTLITELAKKNSPCNSP